MNSCGPSMCSFSFWFHVWLKFHAKAIFLKIKINRINEWITDVSYLMANVEAKNFVCKCTKHQPKCWYGLMLMNIVLHMLDIEQSWTHWGLMSYEYIMVNSIMRPYGVSCTYSQDWHWAKFNSLGPDVLWIYYGELNHEAIWGLMYMQPGLTLSKV